LCYGSTGELDKLSTLIRNKWVEIVYGLNETVEMKGTNSEIARIADVKRRARCLWFYCEPGEWINYQL